MSEADSDSRMTTIIDAATGDQWRVPTRAFEAIIAAFTTARPRLDAETLACAMEQFYSKAEGTMLDSAAAIAAEYIRLTEKTTITDPLRAALDILDVIDGIVDDTHPEGDGCPLCIALDDLRAVLVAETA